VLTSLVGILKPLVFAALGGEDGLEEVGVVFVFEVVVGLLGLEGLCSGASAGLVRRGLGARTLDVPSATPWSVCPSLFHFYITSLVLLHRFPMFWLHVGGGGFFPPW
jgi:hypothetical protein